MDFEICRASVDDAEGVAATHVASWRAGYAGQLPDEFLASLSVETRAASWRSVLNGTRDMGGDTLVVRVERRVMGFASVGASRDSDASEDTGELWALYTHPDVWGGGLGSALHEAATEELRGMGFATATLWVLTSNTRARGFYQRRGWRPEGGTKTDWRGDVRLDEMRYELLLPSPSAHAIDA